MIVEDPAALYVDSLYHTGALLLLLLASSSLHLILLRLARGLRRSRLSRHRLLGQKNLCDENENAFKPRSTIFLLTMTFNTGCCRSRLLRRCVSDFLEEKQTCAALPRAISLVVSKVLTSWTYPPFFLKTRSCTMVKKPNPTVHCVRRTQTFNFTLEGSTQQ